MPNFTPHTDEDIKEMLTFLGVKDIDDLFESIPQNLRLQRSLNITEGASEFEVKNQIKKLADKNISTDDLVSFAGFGAYNHYIPAVTKELASQSEFLTAYTPYQPEVSQGILQALFEYQSLISELTALDVTNASLYDGAHALSEAIHMSCLITGKNKVLISEGVNPNWIKVVKTIASGTNHEIQLIKLKEGVTDFTSPQDFQEIASVVISYPNYLGVIEDVYKAKEFADKIGALLITCYDPIALGILKPPGEFGASIAVAEGQSLGIELSFGGPYLGMLSCKAEFIRRVPGRIVGKTVDLEGNTAYVTTLRTREQDIRREKATSNICTNQTVLAIRVAIHLSWLGPQGLAELAKRCLKAANYLKNGLSTVQSLDLLNAPTFREFAIDLPIAADEFIEKMLEFGYLAGVSLSEWGYENRVLLTANETHKRSQMDDFISTVGKVLS